MSTCGGPIWGRFTRKNTNLCIPTTFRHHFDTFWTFSEKSKFFEKFRLFGPRTPTKHLLKWLATAPAGLKSHLGGPIWGRFARKNAFLHIPTTSRHHFGTFWTLSKKSKNFENFRFFDLGPPTTSSPPPRPPPSRLEDPLPLRIWREKYHEFL